MRATSLRIPVGIAVSEIERVSPSLALEVHVVNAGSEPEFDIAFASLIEQGASQGCYQGNVIGKKL
jgi:hypothetical protein